MAFPGAAYREYSHCLPDYLRELAAQAYRLRNREIARLTTAEAIHTRQRWARETFWKLVGGLPERTPLNQRTLGSFERRGYRVEKILYESRPDFHIPANLYVPTEHRPPFPGILFQMGHSLNGKAAGSYQRCCQGLVQLGYLVLAFDPMGQGERVYYPDSSGTHTRLRNADAEHTVPGKQMLLSGDTSSRLQVWDAVRSLDVLAAHPMVDPKRLASTGQSGGGTLTMLLSCVDDRLAAAVVCDGNTENMACAGFNPPGSTDDAEQDFLGSGPLGFDRWDLLYPIAPKPLLITVSDRDFFGTYSSQYIKNGWEEYGKLKKVYEVLGQPDHLGWVDTPLPHGLSYDSRLQVYSWFGRWLKNEIKPVEEELPTQIEPDETLWVSDTGNVVRSFHGQTPFSLNKARKIVKEEAPLDRLLGVELRGEKQFRVLGRVPGMGIEIEAVEIESAPRVWLPAWLFLPKHSDSSKPMFLTLEPSGRNVRWSEGGLYQSLAQKGYPVCAADLRGVGDLWPECGRGSPRYARSHNDEENYAWASLIFGKPLLGQRVTDILALSRGLRSHPNLTGRKLIVAALNTMTVPALVAAALDSNIDQLYLAGGLVSFQSIIETEDYSYPFGNFVPNLLKHVDLPDIAASIAPRRIVLAGAIGVDNSRMALPAVREIYRNAPNVEVRLQEKWDLDVFIELWKLPI
jgi:dienelactone hydrolase